MTTTLEHDPTPAATPAVIPRGGVTIDDWRPEDEEFWETTGRPVARRNLIWSIFSEHLGFSVWLLWSVSAALSGVYDGSRSVARLRATDLEVAVLGDPEHATGEVVEMTNPIAGSHRRLMIDGGVIVAAALVGDLSRVGLITQLYDRGTVLGPDEPGQLLLAEAAATAVVLADDAEVCACAGVRAGAIRACASFEDCRESTRATTGCGGCEPVVRRLLGEGVAVAVQVG